MNSNYKEIANNFCKFYYEKLGKNVNDIKYLYKNTSLITFLGEELIGPDAYIRKMDKGISSYNLLVILAQPLGNNSILITVNLQKISGFQPCYICETFVLTSENGSFFIANHIIKNL